MTNTESRRAGRRMIDPRVPRFGQGVSGVLLVVAFVADVWWLVPLVALVLGLGAAFGPAANLWSLLYRGVVRPSLRLRVGHPLKDATPPRVANAVAAIVLGLASIALAWGPAPVAIAMGWMPVLVVSGLALLAAFAGLCVVCEVYLRVVGRRARRPSLAG